MENSNIDFEVKFLLDTLFVQVTDNTDYVGQSITPSKVAGLITAKRANTTFHVNTDYNAPDISPGTSLVDSFAGPSGALPESVYNFIYSIQVLDEILGSAKSCSMTNSTTLVFASTDVAAQLTALLTKANSVKVKVYDSGSNLLGEVAASAFVYGGGNITITTAVLATFANADSFRIVTYYSKESSFNFCNTLPVVKIGVFADCLKAQITVTDNTVWPAGYGVTNHLITLQYPRDKSGTPVSASVDTDQYSLVVGPNIYSGGYTISAEADVNYTQDDGLVVSGAVEGFAYPNVQCDATLCCLKDCIAKIHTQYLLALEKGGQAAMLGIQLLNINTYVMRYYLAVDCQATQEASNILTALKNYMQTSGTDCGCGCDDNAADGEPTVITPLYSA